MDSSEGAGSLTPERGGRVRAGLVIGVLVVVGLLGRSIVADGVRSPLLSWLPWLDEPTVTLFFGEASAEYLVPVTRSVSGEDAEPDALVEELLRGPDAGTGLVSYVPEGTTVESVSLADGILEVSLGGSYTEAAFALTHESLYQSMRTWPDVDEVRLTADGMVVEPNPSGHLIYFYDEPRDRLVARPTSAEAPADLLDEYLAGSGRGGIAGLPADVEALGVDLGGNDLLTLSFTFRQSLREYAIDHPESVRRVLEGIIASFTTGFPEVGGVMLDFEGHNALGLGQCANLLNTVQTHPEVLNDERLLSRQA